MEREEQTISEEGGVGILFLGIRREKRVEKGVVVMGGGSG